MQIRLIDGRIPTTPGLLEFVQSHIVAAVGRFAPRLRDVSVRIGDINGPRGGVDKWCVILARVRRAGGGVCEVIAGHRSADYYAAIGVASHAFKRTLARRIDRLDTKHQGRRSVRRSGGSQPGAKIATIGESFPSRQDVVDVKMTASA